eukprot:5019577-Amphidinium_carterae.1
MLATNQKIMSTTQRATLWAEEQQASNSMGRRFAVRTTCGQLPPGRADQSFNNHLRHLLALQRAHPLELPKALTQDHKPDLPEE